MQVLQPAVLCDDAEAVQVTVATGDVKRRVAAVVHQRGVAAGRKETGANVRLVCYHC